MTRVGYLRLCTGMDFSRSEKVEIVDQNGGRRDAYNPEQQSPQTDVYDEHQVNSKSYNRNLNE